MGHPASAHDSSGGSLHSGIGPLIRPVASSRQPSRLGIAVTVLLAPGHVRDERVAVTLAVFVDELVELLDELLGFGVGQVGAGPAVFWSGEFAARDDFGDGEFLLAVLPAAEPEASQDRVQLRELHGAGQPGLILGCPVAGSRGRGRTAGRRFVRYRARGTFRSGVLLRRLAGEVFHVDRGASGLEEPVALLEAVLDVGGLTGRAQAVAGGLRGFDVQSPAVVRAGEGERGFEGLLVPGRAVVLRCRAVVVFLAVGGEHAAGGGGVDGGADDRPFLRPLDDGVPWRAVLGQPLPPGGAGWPLVLVREESLVLFGFALYLLGGLVELALVVSGVAFAGGEDFTGAVGEPFGDGGAVGDALPVPVVVGVDVDAVADAPEAEPLQELLGAGAPQALLVAVGAGDVPVVGAFAEYGFGAGAYLVVEGFGRLGCHDDPGLVLAELAVRVGF